MSDKPGVYVDNVIGYNESQREIETVEYGTEPLDSASPFELVKGLLFELGVPFSSSRIIDGEYSTYNKIELSSTNNDIVLFFEPKKNNLVRMSKTLKEVNDETSVLIGKSSVEYF